MNKGFTQVPNDVILDKDLSASDFRIYTYFLSCTNFERDGALIAYPSLNTIAEKLDISPRTVSYSINRLVELGYIENIQQSKVNESNKFPTNHYQINLERKPNEGFIRKRKVASSNISQKVKNRKSTANNAVVEVLQKKTESTAKNDIKVLQNLQPNNTKLTILNNNIKEQNEESKNKVEALKNQFLEKYGKPRKFLDEYMWTTYTIDALEKYDNLDSTLKQNIDIQIEEYKSQRPDYSLSNILSIMGDAIEKIKFADNIHK